jgi:hypothetical protein
MALYGWTTDWTCYDPECTGSYRRPVHGEASYRPGHGSIDSDQDMPVAHRRRRATGLSASECLVHSDSGPTTYIDGPPTRWGSRWTSD